MHIEMEKRSGRLGLTAQVQHWANSMKLYYCERLDMFGVCEPDWDYVLCLKPVYCNSLGRRTIAQVPEMYVLDGAWSFIGKV